MESEVNRWKYERALDLVAAPQTDAYGAGCAIPGRTRVPKGTQRTSTPTRKASAQTPWRHAHLVEKYGGEGEGRTAGRLELMGRRTTARWTTWVSRA